MSAKTKVITKLFALLEALKGTNTDEMRKALREALVASYSPFDIDMDVNDIIKAEELFHALEEFYDVPITQENAGFIMPIVHSLLKTLDENYIG